MGKSIQKKLDEYRKLEEAATPGPWYVVEKPWRDDNLGTWVIAGSFDPHLGTMVCDSPEILEWPAEQEGPDYSQSDADMAFIATARNTFLGLIQTLEASMAESDRLRKLLAPKMCDYGQLYCESMNNGVCICAMHRKD